MLFNRNWVLQNLKKSLNIFMSLDLFFLYILCFGCIQTEYFELMQYKFMRFFEPIHQNINLLPKLYGTKIILCFSFLFIVVVYFFSNYGNDRRIT